MQVKPQPLNARTLKYWSDRLPPTPITGTRLCRAGHVGVAASTARPGMYHDRLMNQGAALD